MLLWIGMCLDHACAKTAAQALLLLLTVGDALGCPLLLERAPPGGMPLLPGQDHEIHPL
jgi:hypothetical protein